MNLNISTLNSTWSPLPFSEPKERFPSLMALEKESEIQFATPVTMNLEARMVDTHVEVRGTLSYSVSHTCGRCLSAFDETINAEVNLLFVDDPQVDDRKTEDDVELTDDVIGRETYTGDRIDLSSPLQDEAIMALPQNPLCNKGCKGLCNSCGQNLNRKECGCDTVVGHPAFAKLKVLKGGKG